MGHNFRWRACVIGLLLVLLVLLTLNFHQLRLLVERLPDFTEWDTRAETLCAEGVEREPIYVPAYSHIYHNGLPVLMEVALSLRNTDLSTSITISRVDYFDDQGKLLRRYLNQPLILGPLVSAEYLIEKADFAGGMGANFLISWSAAENPSLPLAEALMTGGENGQWVSFGSRGTHLGAGKNGGPCGQRKSQAALD